ncbi:MAG: ubiquinol-cytochrome c reductase iron-sulfur subunit N-terminal domain-containing protein [Pseudomonadota bacterium]
MIIKKAPRILPSEITDESVYKERRRFLGMAALGTAALTTGGLIWPALNALAKSSNHFWFKVQSSRFRVRCHRLRMRCACKMHQVSIGQLALWATL